MRPSPLNNEYASRAMKKRKHHQNVIFQEAALHLKIAFDLLECAAARQAEKRQLLTEAGFHVYYTSETGDPPPDFGRDITSS